MPFLGNVYQVFGLYPEVYYAMICMETTEEQCQTSEEEEETNIEM